MYITITMTVLQYYRVKIVLKYITMTVLQYYRVKIVLKIH